MIESRGGSRWWNTNFAENAHVAACKTTYRAGNKQIATLQQQLAAGFERRRVMHGCALTLGVDQNYVRPCRHNATCVDTMPLQSNSLLRPQAAQRTAAGRATPTHSPQPTLPGCSRRTAPMLERRAARGRSVAAPGARVAASLPFARRPSSTPARCSSSSARRRSSARGRRTPRRAALRLPAAAKTGRRRS